MRPFRAYFSNFDLEASVLRSTRILRGLGIAQARAGAFSGVEV
jgi:hypothetical protein